MSATPQEKDTLTEKLKDDFYNTDGSINEGYSPEDEAAARAELERFLPIRHKESIWDDGEREVLRGEAWEKVFHENQEREKRKAKQIPQVREWIREYQTNKRWIGSN